jgi:D-psicose/D-tagatose/L-ribulose 3-epimerase
LKISASNIIWDSSNLHNFFSLCSELGCSGVELAPDKIWEKPIQSSPKERSDIKHSIEDNGLELVGFHALLYTRNDLKLFKSTSSFQDTCLYLASMASLCSEMGGKNLIMGSPYNRNLCGRTLEDCFDQAIEGFTQLADICKELGVNFCIEPLPPFQTEFITSASEGERLVKAVNHPNFCLHLDASALRLESFPPELVIKESITPQHFHVNDPGLAVPGSSTKDLPLMIKALRNKNYEGFFSIEVVPDGSDPRDILKSSVEYVRQLLENN